MLKKFSFICLSICGLCGLTWFIQHTLKQFHKQDEYASVGCDDCIDLIR